MIITKNQRGISMVSVVITVIVIIILSTIVITSSSESIYQAGENKILQELAEVKKGVDTVRLSNAKGGKTDEETINAGFIKVIVENPPESFVSFDEDNNTGYAVDLSVIDYEKLETGRGYLSLNRYSTVTFDVDDVFVYDNAGKVYYTKGYQIGDGDIGYTGESEERKEGPIVELISTENKIIKVKVTPVYGGVISSVIVNTKRATTNDGVNFEYPVAENGTYKVIATEEGGNSSVLIVEIGDIKDTASEVAQINDVYINNHEKYTNKQVATLHIEATNAEYMCISQNGLDIPIATDLSRWRKYEESITITLKEGLNQVYVWCKNADNIPTEHKMAQITLDSIAPTRDAPTYSMNGFQILVTSQQKDDSPTDLTIKYGYKKESDSNYIWQDNPIILDVEPSAKYLLITRATDMAGNTSESRTTLTEPVLSIPDDIVITSNPSIDWATRVTVQIEYPGTYRRDPFENLYRIDGGEWQVAESDRITMTVIKNSKIEAVVSAKLNGQDTKMGKIKVHTIQNIDRVDPYIHDIEDIGPYRQDGFDIKAKVYDKESGLVAWTVTTSKEEPTSWYKTFDTTTELIEMSFRVEKNDTYYFWAKDEGGNTGYIGLDVTNIDLYDPVINSYTIDYGTGQAVLTAKAVDTELGLNGYAFMKGQNAVPTEADWISIPQTTVDYTMTTTVTENDYYTIWVKDVSGRTAKIQEYVRVKYVVTYDYKTNKGDSISISGGNTLIVGCNSYVDLSPRATREYSNFIGWHTDPNSKSAIGSIRIGDPTVGQEDIRIYAIFQYVDEIYYSKSNNSLTYELYLTITKKIPFSTLQYSTNNSNWYNYTGALYINTNRTVYTKTIIDGEIIETSSYTITNICENHTFSTATCTSDSRCTKCNKYNGPALGHSMGGWYTVYDATCTSNGLRRKNCNRGCGHYQTSSIGAYGHSTYTTSSGTATCVSTVTYKSYCRNCGGYMGSWSGGYGGHNWVKYGASLDSGIQGRKCTYCGKIQY